ncbi:MAG: GNAT family N-acetyltransferase [Candidatus Lokiarchaeota archaeon]|nr:GNAT family N-acetyltransferase [Candidatus Lokiarchaeota archaeon]
MSIKAVIRDDLIYLARIEHDVFGTDAFGVYILHNYFDDNIFFIKLVLPENNSSEKIIGFSIVTKLAENAIRKNPLKKLNLSNTTAANIDNFLIIKKYWGKGYGKMMLNHIITKLSDLKYSRVLLEVNTHNVRGIKLYKSQGFRIIGKKKAYYQSGADAFVMMKDICYL